MEIFYAIMKKFLRIEANPFGVLFKIQLPVKNS